MLAPLALGPLDVVVVLGLPLLIISIAAWRMMEAFEPESDEED
ncbi:hypothetical protein [Halosegnis longus]|nr:MULTISPECIES: hypothetical protein [Halobacteriales]